MGGVCPKVHAAGDTLRWDIAFHELRKDKKTKVGYLSLMIREKNNSTKSIAGFHSRDQQPCFSTKTKGSVCIIIELNSRRIWSGHQHGRHFFV